VDLVNATECSDHDVARLTAHVRTLSHDDAFGMLTRPALIFQADRLPSGSFFMLYCDLDQLHDLNGHLGYEEVNRRVRHSFAPALRQSDLVGRWFSGDEILIILPDDSRLLWGLVQRLQREAESQGFSFSFALGTWRHPDQNLVSVVSRLARHVLRQKEVSMKQR